ncbi:MAG: hypothetical protein ABL308_00675 [Oceanicaulis sp.]
MKPLAAAFRASLIVLAGLAAAACFASVEPLEPGRETASPIPSGLYARWDEAEDSQGPEPAEPDWTGRIERVDGQIFAETDPDFPYADARYFRLARDIWAVRHPPGAEGFADDAYMYTLIRRDGRARFLTEIPICDMIEPEVRAEIGLALDEEDVCRAETDEQLRAGLLAYIEASDARREEEGRLAGFSLLQRTR